MSAGVIDLICSKNVPTGVKRLVDHLKSDIKKGDIVPFYGEIRAQDGTLKNKKDKAMKPEAIMEMDWLTDNVIGEIPTIGRNLHCKVIGLVFPALYLSVRQRLAHGITSDSP